MADIEVHIDLGGRTRPVGLARSNKVRSIIKEVAVVTATWRETAKEAGARPAEITRMARTFEHDDLKRSLAL